MKKIIAVLIVMLSCTLIYSQAKFIPSITAADVHMNFTNKGFTLKKSLGSNPYWDCTKTIGNDMQSVTAYGISASNIFKVEAMSTQGNMHFLAYVASLPYAGSKPSAAAAWVMSHKDGGVTKIGAVTFNLYKGTGKTMVIEMSVK